MDSNYINPTFYKDSASKPWVSIARLDIDKSRLAINIHQQGGSKTQQPKGRCHSPSFPKKTPYRILFIFFHVNNPVVWNVFFVASTSSPNKNRHQEDCVGDTQKFHDGLVMSVEQLAIFSLTKWEANEKLAKGFTTGQVDFFQFENSKITKHLKI